MEKNTILAVVLSTVVLVSFYVIQGVFFPRKPLDSSVQYQPPVSAVAEDKSPIQEPLKTAIDAPISEVAAEPAAKTEETPDSGPQTEQFVTVDTDLITVVLTSKGGDMVSWKLKEHKDKEDNVDMILSGSRESRAFTLAFGGLDAYPLTSFFYVNRISAYSVEFYRDFTVPAGASPNADGKFRLTKRYDFKPADYMFELTVTIDGSNTAQGFNFSGSAYTLAFGPQIGPSFQKLDNRYEYRQYVTFTNGKRKNVKVNDIIDTRPSWAAISGKYFTFIALPYLAQFSLSFSEKAEPGITSASRLSIVRPVINASKASDTYRFYLGPKNQEVLANYNTGKNDFGLKDMNLIEVSNTKGILAPLERL
jgi:YidC/Oxa1 family membrane protein insertase